MKEMQINNRKAAMCGANLVRTVLFMMICLVCNKQFLGKIIQKYIYFSQLISAKRLKNVEMTKVLICQFKQAIIFVI
jgi:hypothetical protein